MVNSRLLYIVLIMFWFISRGILCEHLNEPGNCDNYKNDTTSIPFDVTNQAAIYHLQDTIKIFSKFSDTINTLSGQSFVTPVSKAFAYIQTFKVVPWGTSYGLDYANNEFNFFVNNGTFQNIGWPGYNVLFERIAPYNTADLFINPGDTGLYLFTVWLQDEYYGGTIHFNNGNDPCNYCLGMPGITVPKQNRQYWDSLGVSSLGLINSNASPTNKTDENYFFVKVVP